MSVRPRSTNCTVTVGLGLILLTALGLRLVRLGAPLLETYGWRQCETAMIARNYARHGRRLFWPEFDTRGRKPGWVGRDLPVYSYLVSLLYRVFGVHEYLGRLLNALLSVLTVVLVYLLGARAFGTAAGLWAAGLYAVSPELVFFGRTYQPEALMLLCGVLSLWTLWLGLTQQRPRFLALSAVFLSLSALMKPTMLHLLVPAGYLWWHRRRRRALRSVSLWLWLAVVMVPSVLWYVHASHLQRLSGIGLGSLVDPGALFSLGDWLKPAGRTLVLRLVILVTTPVGLFALLAALRRPADRGRWLFHIWTLSGLLYFVLLPRIHLLHHYYQLPLFAPFILLMSRTLAELSTDRRQTTVLACLLALSLLPAAFHVSHWYRWEPDLLECARAVRRHTSPTELVISVSPEGEALPYYADRRGYHGFATLLTPARLATWVREGAHTLAAAPRGYWTHLPEETEKILRRDWTLIAASPRYRLYRLRTGVTGSPTLQETRTP